MKAMRLLPILLTAALVSPTAGAVVPDRAAVRIADARLKFEINATDRDGGVQVFLDAEDWRRMTIYDTSGQAILTTEVAGKLSAQGGTELFMETGEPPFTELPLRKLLKKWPEGRYEFRGETTDGTPMVGAARLSHAIPRGPRLLAPLEGGPAQPRDDTVLRWKRVPAPDGSRIIGYQVLVVEPDTGLRALPKITLDVMMPPSASRFRVPRGFLRPDTEYEWEVLALERGGNQTLSSSTFKTR